MTSEQKKKLKKKNKKKRQNAKKAGLSSSLNDSFAGLSIMDQGDLPNWQFMILSFSTKLCNPKLETTLTF